MVKGRAIRRGMGCSVAIATYRPRETAKPPEVRFRAILGADRTESVALARV